MACLSHPEASTETCRPCGMTYCTGTGCGHTCPPRGVRRPVTIDHEATPEDFQQWVEEASRVNARLVAISLGVVIGSDARIPELHLAFTVPCGCPHADCPETEGVIMHLSMEDKARLLEGLQTMEAPEVMLKVMALMDEPTD